MNEPRYSEEELDRAIAGLSEEGRLREAEAVVAQRMPALQRILATALESGGWFAEVRESEIRKATGVEEPADRESALRTLLAEETRIGMFVGVVVGLELARTLDGADD